MTSVGRDDSARRLTGFRPLGEFLFPRRKRNQNAAGGGLRWASPPIVAPPRTPIYGGYPYMFPQKFRRAKYGFGFHSSRATGPWCSTKFRLVPFYSRAWFRPAVADGTGRGAHRTEPFRKQKTGGPVSRPYGVSDKSPGQREGQASLLWGDGEAFCGGRLHGTAPTQGNTPRCRPGRGGATLSPTGARGPQCAPTQKFPAPGDNSL